MILDHLAEWRRTHTCGALRGADAGQRIRVAGWVHRARDHGGVFFLDLRDRHGLVQVVFRPGGEKGDELCRRARELGSEFVVAVEGDVALRPEAMVNPKMPTGEIEIIAVSLRVLNDSQTPPFVLEGATSAGEDLRLEYRYLDLRRPELLRILGLRHHAAFSVRQYLNGRGFWEIETPMLVRPTPEGARDFLVPSRAHPGSFYALPQSPQLYKQILMVAGMDRYFQIARCLRDEDTRADRQPEFSQIDLEMSFIGEDDIYELTEGMMQEVFAQVLGATLDRPFPRLTWRETMERYGSDKPDLRFDYPIVDVSEETAGSTFRVFEEALAAGGVVRLLNLPGGGACSRKEQDELEALVRRFGAKGLVRARVAGGALDGGAAKFLSPELQAKLILRGEAAEGDLLALVAGPREMVEKSLGALRSHLGNRWLEQHPEAANTWRFLWVTEFPLFERDADTGGFTPAHHMFTMPREDDLPWLESDPLRVRGRLYDLVLNGYELGSGSIRIHRRDVQEAVMRVIGVGREEAERKFGFLLKAFQYGAPPHGGIALGFDRVVMLMAGRTSLRDTIAFPKSTTFASLMDGAPSPVQEEELKELSLRLAGNPGRPAE